MTVRQCDSVNCVFFSSCFNLFNGEVPIVFLYQWIGGPIVLVAGI